MTIFDYMLFCCLCHYIFKVSADQLECMCFLRPDHSSFAAVKFDNHTESSKRYRRPISMKSLQYLQVCSCLSSAAYKTFGDHSSHTSIHPSSVDTL
jgi:hypothetical protein